MIRIETGQSGALLEAKQAPAPYTVAVTIANQLCGVQDLLELSTALQGLAAGVVAQMEVDMGEAT